MMRMADRHEEITTCLVSENSGLVVQGYHAPECIAIPIYYERHTDKEPVIRPTQITRNMLRPSKEAESIYKGVFPPM